MEATEMFSDADVATYYAVGSVEEALHLCQRLRGEWPRVCAFGPYGCGGDEGYRVYLNP